MKTSFLRWSLLIGAPVVAFVIYRYNVSLIPDFDIGLNAGFIMLECLGVTLLATAAAVFILHKLTSAGRGNGWHCLFVVSLYWLIVWGFCYGKCVLEATRVWQEMMYGEVG